MSINSLRVAFEEMRRSYIWSLQLLKITTSKSLGTRYAARQIRLESMSEMTSLIEAITDKYLSSGKGSLDSYSDITDYNGTAIGTTIYRLDKNDPLIAAEYGSFLAAIADPDTEADAFAFTSAYVLKGTVTLGEESVPVKLVSMQNPITNLKQKYQWMHPTGTFRQITDPILTLRTSVDVVILGDRIYFLTMAGENLFNMARAYKSVCHGLVTELEAAGFIAGIEKFKGVAESGHNPRRFVSFNRERFNALQDIGVRQAMAVQFSIPLDGENRFNSDIDGAAEKIVRLLCNKGMVDPFNNTAVEVVGAKSWQ